MWVKARRCACIPFPPLSVHFYPLPCPSPITVAGLGRGRENDRGDGGKTTGCTPALPAYEIPQAWKSFLYFRFRFWPEINITFGQSELAVKFLWVRDDESLPPGLASDTTLTWKCLGHQRTLPSASFPLLHATNAYLSYTRWLLSRRGGTQSIHVPVCNFPETMMVVLTTHRAANWPRSSWSDKAMCLWTEARHQRFSGILSKRTHHFISTKLKGVENAGLENAGSPYRGWKTREWKRGNPAPQPTSLGERRELPQRILIF